MWTVLKVIWYWSLNFAHCTLDSKREKKIQNTVYGDQKSMIHNACRQSVIDLFLQRKLPSSLFNNLDPRTNDWPLISSPIPGLTILAVYLYFILSWGPRHMANRKPYKLENVLIAYNLIQVIVSTYIFYEVIIKPAVICAFLDTFFASYYFTFYALLYGCLKVN